MVLVSAELNMLEASVKEIVICLMYQYITTTTNLKIYTLRLKCHCHSPLKNHTKMS